MRGYIQFRIKHAPALTTTLVTTTHDFEIRIVFITCLPSEMRQFRHPTPHEVCDAHPEVVIVKRRIAHQELFGF